jgi:hypothetical protein
MPKTLIFQGFADFKVERFSDLGGKHFGGRRKHFQRKVESISRTGGNRFMLRGKANQGV